MQVAIYVRVSRQDQNLEQQISALEDFCKKENYEIYKIYKEQGVSGAKVSRPQLDLMLQDMRNRLFDCIVVWKFDRLGRSTMHLLQVLEELKNRNIRLIATSQNIDTSTSMGKFFFTILSGFAELEREFIRERTQSRLDYYKKQIRKKGYAITKEGKKIKTLGRPKGSRDKSKRTRSGYYLRWKK